MKTGNSTKMVIFSLMSISLIFLICLASFGAAKHSTSAEVLAELTSKTQEVILNERASSGNNYCRIANEAGVLEAYHKEIILISEDAINKMADDKTLTRVEADALILALKDTPDFCDGYGNEGFCYNYYNGEENTSQYGRHHNQASTYSSRSYSNNARGCCGRGRSYN